MTLTQVFRAALVGTLAFLLALALAALFLGTINIWISVLTAILVASAVRPVVRRLMGWRIPQGAAIIIVYAGIAFTVIGLLVVVLPPVVNQFVGYLQNDDLLANRIITAQVWIERNFTQFTGTELNLGIAPDDIRATVAQLVDNVRITAPTLFDDVIGFLGEFILVLVMGIYWITSRERAENFLVELAPLSRRPQVRAIIDEMELSLGAYVRGLILVSLVVGLLSFVVLIILQVPNAVTLSFFYGVATAVPIIGGLIGVVVATGLALLTSPLNGFIVFIVTVLIQQVENYFLTPRIMSQNTEFDPILVIVFVAAGFTLNGVVGALIAIPIAGIVAILLKHMVFEPRKGSVTPSRVDGGILLRPDEPDPKDSILTTK